MSRWQTISLGIGALFAWLVIEAVSIIANAKFGASLGHSELDSTVLAAASVASDVLKAVTPLAFLWFIATRRWAWAVAAFVIGITTVLFSLMAALGFVSGERYRTFYEAEDARQLKAELQQEIEQTRENAGWVVAHRPPSVVQADIEAREADRMFRRSESCGGKIRGELEEWCRDYRQLHVELAGAIEAEKQKGEIQSKREQIREQGRSYGDAQIGLINEWTGIDQKIVLRWLIVLTVALIEFGSSFGLTVSLGLLTSTQTAFGREVHKAIGVVRKRAPDPDAVQAAIKPAPPREKVAPSFPNASAGTPEGRGIREKLIPVVVPTRRDASAA